ncbi:hypothetical protein EDB81DRAFT_904038, partial [Dactylonectria macrodidyma]
SEKRVSKACLARRSRNTRCDLGIPVDPRVVSISRRTKRCVLATSRRGSRRVKGLKATHYSHRHPASSTPVPDRNITIVEIHGRDEAFGADGDRNGLESEERSDRSPSYIQSELDQPGSASNQEADESTKNMRRLEGHITITDLLNPSDAPEVLARVAGLGPEGRNHIQVAPNGDIISPGQSSGTVQPVTYYPPISSGALTISDVSVLIKHYHDNFHPFFPIACRAIFDDGDIADWIEREQHLITAILTIATKDDPAWCRAHESCAQHMESLISKLIYAGSDAVGAVEALLILAEWASQPPEQNSMVGCGKEDLGSWMLVGIAIRLAHLQRSELPGLMSKDEVGSERGSRQRIAYAACYMSDRQLSILGETIWSRGSGPSIFLQAADFPSLQVQKLGNENFALLFQAHLEITQLFSNAHDILYSSTSQGGQPYMSGEYVRHIDDLCAVLRTWKLAWGGPAVTPCVKASLMLSYDFLRLYINAHAFQSNLDRAVHRACQRSSSSAELKEPLFSDLAGAPDARFIYESIDAAKSLLCISNDVIDPETELKYMPLKFFLYVTYAAIYLLKAIPSGVITASDATEIRCTVHETILRLQRASNSRQSPGQRYAQLLRPLWQKLVERREAQVGDGEAAAKSATTAAREVSPFGPTEIIHRWRLGHIVG